MELSRENLGEEARMTAYLIQLKGESTPFAERFRATYNACAELGEFTQFWDRFWDGARPKDRVEGPIKVQ